ncbi:MAG: futalosine hydrolase [Chitinophagaceae bacterium]|nr:MAG: futalosine hydrolase [Chitinophagaceae bacterium]
MNILLVSATEFEIAPFRDHFINNPGEYPGISLTFLKTGVGLVATAIRLTKELSVSNPELLIQAGIAGTFDNNTQLGTVYRVNRDRIADLGVEEEGTWKDVFDLNLADQDAPPFLNGWLNENDSVKFFAGIPSASAISVNEITTRRERIQQLVAAYDPVLESMEGAAFHEVAMEFRLPFVQIRAVSNYIGERNKANWKMKDAINNLNEALKTEIALIASGQKDKI